MIKMPVYRKKTALPCTERKSADGFNGTFAKVLHRLIPDEKIFLSSRRHRRRVVRGFSRRIPSRRFSSHMRRIFSGGILFHMRILFLRGFLHMRRILPLRIFSHTRRIVRTGAECMERLLRRPVIGCISRGADSSGSGKNKGSQGCSNDDVLFHDGFSFHPLCGNREFGAAGKAVPKKCGENQARLPAAVVTVVVMVVMAVMVIVVAVVITAGFLIVRGSRGCCRNCGVNGCSSAQNEKYGCCKNEFLFHDWISFRKPIWEYPINCGICISWETGKARLRYCFLAGNDPAGA